MDASVSLRDPTYFPSFDNLPSHDNASLDYYHEQSFGLLTPSKHWCFFAEIQGTEHIIDPIVYLKDTNGKLVKLVYPLDQGESIDLTPAWPGLTVAVLYAHRCNFSDGTQGVRNDHRDSIHVLPMDPTKLFELSDKANAQKSGPDGLRVCAHCKNVKAADMKRCGGCLFMYYCSRECQVASWHDGHKQECKKLKTLGPYLRMDWANYQARKFLPL